MNPQKLYFLFCTHLLEEQMPAGYLGRENPQESLWALIMARLVLTLIPT